MNEKSLAFELAVAGLLHDIGKVLQPAGVELSNDAKMITQMICPVFKGNYSHRHVLYTAHVLFKTESNYGGLDSKRIERVANYHHRPTENLDEVILTKADWLASGHDRRSADVEEERTGLIPITSILSVNQAARPATDQFTIPTGSLDFKEGNYLPEPKKSKTEYREACEKLSEQILSELSRNYESPEECVDSLLSLTQRIMHSVPASRYKGHTPDVSLFDHSRMVAAIAACLGKLEHANHKNPNEISGKYRFVTLGLGGIQNFIFHSTPPLEPNEQDEERQGDKGSAKRLRARSFYISLCSWLASRKILASIGLPVTNVVYDAGGHSLLLIPDRDDLVDQVKVTLRELAQKIHSDLGGSLRFDYAIGDSLQDHHFNSAQFEGVFREVEADRANSKLRFPDDQLQKSDGWSSESWIRDRSASLPIDRKAFQDKMRDLGNALPKAQYLVIGSKERGRWCGDILGESVSLHDKKPNTGRVFSLYLNEDLTVPFYLGGNHLPVADSQAVDEISRKETSNEEPVIQAGETLTFSDLAGLSSDDDQRRVKHSMLGALKADIDLLGALISYGLSPKNSTEDDRTSANEQGATLGRLAAISRSLDQFFKGFLVEQIAQKYQKIYTVFLGGDDLFLVGPWYDLVRFTRDFKTWFDRMTCDNQEVTFSAGLVFTSPSIPIRQLATEAEGALEKSKFAGRNRLTYGDIVMNWNQYQRALELHRLLLKCSEDSMHGEKINTSLTYRLLQYAQQGMRTAEPNKFEKLPFAVMKWRSQLSYDLKRNLPQPKQADSDLAKLHSELIKIQSPHEDCPVLYVASSLTLYYLRGEGK